MIPIILTLAFFILFGIVHGLRTNELNALPSKRKAINRKWHKYQAGMHVVFAVLVALHFPFFKAIAAGFLVIAINWIFFDLAHNLTTGQDWYYHEDSGINGWLKSKVREIGIIAIKAILLSSLFIIFIIL